MLNSAPTFKRYELWPSCSSFFTTPTSPGFMEDFSALMSFLLFLVL